MLKFSLLVVPVSVVLFVGAYWYGRTADANALHARLYTGPYPHKVFAVRAVVGYEGSALGQPRPASDTVRLRLLVEEPGGAKRVHEASTNSHGVADFNAELESANPSHLSLRLEDITTERQRTLAHGVWVRDELSAGWRNGGTLGSIDGAELTPQLPGLRVRVEEGVLAVPFVGVLSVLSEIAIEADVTLTLSGALFEDTSRRARIARLSGGVPQRLRIRPTAHIVELSVHNSLHNDTAHAVLPVVPGAMTVSSEGELLHVLSPVPRSHAYLAFVTEQELLQLHVVPLQPPVLAAESPAEAAPDTFVSRGQVQLSGQVRAQLLKQPVWAVTSSEPDLQAMASVGWPVNLMARGEARKRSLSVVVDGFVQARESQQSERRAMRLRAVKMLSGALLIELLLLGLYVRASATRDVRVLPFLDPFAGRTLWLGAACVVLGFVALAYLFWLRF